jgi:hypothetical protein
MTQNPDDAAKVPDPNAIKKVTMREEAVAYIKDLLGLAEIDLPALSQYDLEVRLDGVGVCLAGRGGWSRLYWLLLFPLPYRRSQRLYGLLPHPLTI